MVAIERILAVPSVMRKDQPKLIGRAALVFEPGCHELLYLSLVAYIAETRLRLESSEKILRYFEADEA